MQHPYLFFAKQDLPALRERMSRGFSHHITENIIYSAEKYLDEELFDGNFEWVKDEKYGQYAQLYAYFYGYMEAASYIQHYSFAWLLTEDERYAEHARAWLLGPTRDWGLEWGVPQERDGGYATDRLLLGVALGYDWLYDYLSQEDREIVRDALISQCDRYWPYHLAMADNPRVDTHASYEIPCYGVACMALLDEDPGAAERVERMGRKCVEHFLPHAPGKGGPGDDRAIYWIFPLFYQMLFHHAYRHVTGKDILSPFRGHCDPSYALYTLCNQPRKKDLFKSSENRAFRAGYMQQDGASPALFGIASYFKEPYAQWCATRDRNAGRIQFTKYLTPTGQRLLFAHGPFCYLWYDENVPAKPPTNLPEVWHYNAGEGNNKVNQLFVRTSWDLDRLYAALDGRNLGVLIAANGKTLVPHLAAPSPPGGSSKVVEYGEEEGYNWARVSTDAIERQLVTCGSDYALICDLPLSETPQQQVSFNTAPGGKVKTEEDIISLHDEWAQMQLRVLWPREATIAIAESKSEWIVGLGQLKLDVSPRIYYSVTIAGPAGKVGGGFVLLAVPEGSYADVSMASIQEAGPDTVGLSVCVPATHAKGSDTFTFRVGKAPVVELATATEA